MKVAFLLVDSMYALAVFDRGGTGRDVVDSGFTGAREIARGDGIAGARSMGRGRHLSEQMLESLGLLSGQGWVLALLPIVPFRPQWS